ncbi:MAG: hypothetical protein LBS97_07030 [Treponema sp.]|jgi:hypothetical protein|nr:hypothetical protein [Treponema sp.]
MKKTAQIIGSLLSVLLAMVLVVGCGDGNDDEKKEEDVTLLTSTFTPYYLSLGDFSLTGADNTIHLKNKADHVVGIEIEQIYVANSKSLTGAKLVWDFTTETPNVNAYWGFDAGTKTGAKWTSGETAAPADAGGETYITGFGSGAAFQAFDGVDATYWVFVAKNLSDTVKGDEVTIEIGGGDPFAANVSKTFAELFIK